MKTKQVLPFDEWKQKTNPTDNQIALYHQVTEAIKTVEEHTSHKKIATNKLSRHART